MAETRVGLSRKSSDKAHDEKFAVPVCVLDPRDEGVVKSIPGDQDEGQGESLLIKVEMPYQIWGNAPERGLKATFNVSSERTSVFSASLQLRG